MVGDLWGAGGGGGGLESPKLIFSVMNQSVYHKGKNYVTQ